MARLEFLEDEKLGSLDELIRVSKQTKSNQSVDTVMVRVSRVAAQE